jgi:hypothetical protein
MRTKNSVSHVGWDIHRVFSKVTARDRNNRVLWRRKLDHRDRSALRAQLRCWRAGTPVILESTFGWGWISDDLRAAGLAPHLANSRKVAAWRDAGGRFRAIHDRVADGGRNTGRAYLAVAHELCRIGYVLLKKQVVYSAACPARPGQRARQSRPGPGQPEDAMVAAVR